MRTDVRVTACQTLLKLESFGMHSRQSMMALMALGLNDQSVRVVRCETFSTLHTRLTLLQAESGCTC